MSMPLSHGIEPLASATLPWRMSRCKMSLGSKDSRLMKLSQKERKRERFLPAAITRLLFGVISKVENGSNGCQANAIAMADSRLILVPHKIWPATFGLTVPNNGSKLGAKTKRLSFPIAQVPHKVQRRRCQGTVGPASLRRKAGVKPVVHSASLAYGIWYSRRYSSNVQICLACLVPGRSDAAGPCMDMFCCGRSHSCI